MAGICLLVADGERGKVYRAPGPLPGAGGLEIIYEQLNFQRRLKGRASSSAVEALAQGQEEFARTLCRVLQHACEAGAFDRLAIAAPPPFLELLARHLSDECKRALIRSLDRNLLECSEREIASLLGLVA